MLILAGGAVYYFRVYLPAHQLPTEVAYVLPLSAVVVDTPAEIRLDVETVSEGEKVYVLNRTRNWAHIRLEDGKAGWLELKDLLDSETYERGQAQVHSMDKIPPQATGHVTNEVNVRLDPSRESAQLALLEPNEKVQIFGRRYVARAPKEPAPPEEAASPQNALREAWYLVRSGSRGGWVLGRFITLDVPPEISAYTEGVNSVAWVVLDTVADEGHNVPQYLVADRMDAPEFDFNHIRVFTWWAKNQHYVTAYVESNLDAYFPILVSKVEGKPIFRLRLVDNKGNKFQKVYELSDTIVHSIGRVEGWESDAMPVRSELRPRFRRRR